MRKSSRMRGRLLLLALLLGVGVLGAMRESRIGGDLAWANSYEEGRALARRTGRPLLLSFHTPGCAWCRKMDAETFTDPKVVELSRRLVCISLDSDTDAALIEQYQVSEFPMTILAYPQGKEIARVSGYIPPDRFASALNTLLQATDAKK